MAQTGAGDGVTVERLGGGRNNRLFRVRTPARAAVMKWYFHSEDDTRDRLDCEYRFAAFAWKRDAGCVPQPLAFDADERVALYEFVHGREIAPGQIDADLVRQALTFYETVNSGRNNGDAAELPPASESCFTIDGHLRCVDERVRRLAEIESVDDLDSEARQFVATELIAAWERVAAGVRRAAERTGLSLDEELADASRCLSPSDFGFHNAIMEPTGRVRFIDFEYAGWDDPAKLVCDFFCQEAVPVPLEYFDRFASAAVRHLADPEALRQRIDMLLPVYRIKWCCIVLNDFLPTGRDRRGFAHGHADEAVRKAHQLEKSRAALRRVACA